MKLKKYPTIIIDNREKLPVLYDKTGNPDFPGLKTCFGFLETGDYSIKGMSLLSDPFSITIERKSLPDLFQSVGKNRKRFEREFERMSKYDYAALVIEADFETLFLNPPERSRMTPKSVFRTILAWCQRYNVHCFPCPSRAFSEKTIYLLLMRFWEDRQPGEKMYLSKI